jgi:hypothetical protein
MPFDFQDLTGEELSQWKAILDKEPEHILIGRYEWLLDGFIEGIEHERFLSKHAEDRRQYAQAPRMS